VKKQLTGRVAIVAGTVLLVAGCAIFPDKQLPEVTTLPNKSQFASRPSVALDVKYRMDPKGGEGGAPTENVQMTANLKGIVEEITKESTLFSRHSMDAFDAKNMDYSVKLELIERADMGPALVGAIITGLSLYIIPSKVSVEYELNATVSDRNGAKLKSYQLKDGLSMWQGIVFLPFGEKSLAETPKRIVGNMVKNLYQGMANDNVLRYSWNAPRSYAWFADAAVTPLVTP
jgi:hypothetical protein